MRNTRYLSSHEQYASTASAHESLLSKKPADMLEPISSKDTRNAMRCYFESPSAKKMCRWAESDDGIRERFYTAECAFY